MKTNSLLLGIIFILASSSCATDPHAIELAGSLTAKEVDALKTVGGQFPEISKSCVIGPEKVQIRAVLAQTDLQELKPFILIHKKDEVKAHLIETRIEGAFGLHTNFLSDVSIAEDSHIICDHPKQNKNLYEHIGHFQVAPDMRQGDFVCFAASAVYNSWVCYTIAPSQNYPILAFVQMQAD
jgi:hypothetical protein